MHLSGLFIYPVKSLRGCAVTSAAIDPLGLVGDRRFLVVGETGRFLTQRTYPRMALIATGLAADTLTLATDSAGSITVARSASNAPLRTVSIWKNDDLQAEDCGDTPATWLSDFLGVKCRLMRVGPAFQRPILKPDHAQPGDLVAANDSDPFLIIGENSLGDLNARLAAEGHVALPMDRFRPNLVVSGSEAFAEDTWMRFRIGEMIFRASGPCSRCVITTTDQLTAERGKEPLRLLATYRRDPVDPTDVNFGQNLIHETKSGTLSVGDPVEVLE